MITPGKGKGKIEYLDEHFNLKKSNSVFTQIQIQLFVTGLKKAILFVYSEKDCKEVEVREDSIFQ